MLAVFQLTVRYKDITAITKERTARVIPNAIQICTRDEKYFLTSFGARDKTYVMLFRVWQNALLEQVTLLFLLAFVTFFSVFDILSECNDVDNNKTTQS